MTVYVARVAVVLTRLLVSRSSSSLNDDDARRQIYTVHTHTHITVHPKRRPGIGLPWRRVYSIGYITNSSSSSSNVQNACRWGPKTNITVFSTPAATLFHNAPHLHCCCRYSAALPSTKVFFFLLPLKTRIVCIL
jgi:hypothetical protein